MPMTAIVRPLLARLREFPQFALARYPLAPINFAHRATGNGRDAKDLNKSDNPLSASDMCSRRFDGEKTPARILVVDGDLARDHRPEIQEAGGSAPCIKCHIGPLAGRSPEWGLAFKPRRASST